MIVLRNKAFAVPKPGAMVGEDDEEMLEGLANEGKSSQEVTARNLQLEQMKTQRQRMQIQHQRQQMEAKERMAENRRLTQLQRMEQEKDEDEKKVQAKVQKQANGREREEKDNTALYKTKNKPTTPVSMKV